MAIATLDEYLTSKKQNTVFRKVAGSITSIHWTTTWNLGSEPAAGSLSIGNTSSGVVPDNTTTGAVAIQTFSGTGYLTRVSLASSPSYVAQRVLLYDRIFHAGSFAAAVGTTSLSSQPSYSARVPGGDYRGLEIWAEMASAKTGSSSCRVTYTNENGTTGQVSETVSAPSNAAGGLVRIPLAAGDFGVQTIENFEVTAQTNGNTWNVFVARPLWMGAQMIYQQPLLHGLDLTCMPVVYETSCIAGMIRPMTTFVAGVDIELEIASA